MCGVVFRYVVGRTVYAGSSQSTGSGSISAAMRMTSTVMTEEEWVHVAGVYDSSTSQWIIYCNGALAAATPSPQGAPQKSTAPWLIGSSTNHAFYGAMCEVTIIPFPALWPHLYTSYQTPPDDRVRRSVRVHQHWPCAAHRMLRFAVPKKSASLHLCLLFSLPQMCSRSRSSLCAGAHLECGAQ